MKIAVISPGSFSVPPVIGSSVEHDIQMISTELAKENEVIVYTKACPEYPMTTRVGNLIYKRFIFQHQNKYLEKVIKHLQRVKPDVILVENRPSYCLRIKDALPRIPIILNMHSTVFASPPHILSHQMTEVSKKTTALITNSQYLRSFFVRKYSIFSHKVYAIHLGIDPTPFEQAKKQVESIQSWKTKLHIGEEDQIMLFVGRMIKEKGLHLLLDVMPELIRRHPKVKLIVAGSPRYGKNDATAYLRKLHKQAMKLHQHVCFTGFIRPNQIPLIFQLADVVVVPSVWHEPFGRVNLEAMASAKAVIATNRGGIPEVIVHEKNGLIIPIHRYKTELKQSISRILSDGELRRSFEQKGLEMVKSFTWQKTAEQYMRLFQSIVGGEERG
jgi:spore coat protein SA